MTEPALKAAHPHNAARHPQPQRVSPAQALVWLKAGWGYFIGNPGIWIAISVIFIVMLFVLGLVPLLGWAVVLIGFPVMVAGMVLGCHAQARGEPLRIEHLFAGLKVHAGNLALVGVFYLLGGLIAGFVSVIIVGGAALTGFQLDGREIVGLRGYDDFSLSPTTGNFVVSKYTAELRFPVSLNPQATIYTLAFAQAGNTWNSFDKFEPFRLYRSAGVGLRLFLPMFGPMGLDYGWRLDDVPTAPNMAKSQFHFTIGIDLGEL